MFTVIYKHTNRNLDTDITLSQYDYTLKTITDYDRWLDFYDPNFQKVKFNNSLQEPANKNDTLIFPVDFQSTKLNSVVYSIEKLCGDAMAYKNKKKVILLYTSTEPFFFKQEDSKLTDLVKKFPNLTFILSGSGHSAKSPQAEILLQQPNVHFITKLWYFDRVHYNTQIKDSFTDRHMKLSEETAPEGTPDYVTCPNKFLLTMRNPRSHRMLMSALIENSKVLEATRYSRNWSLKANHITGLHHDSETEHEAIYQTHLILDSIDELAQELQESLLSKVIKTALGHTHILDMPNIGDRGHPGKWLYDNINIAVIAGGEGSGYGYADEKQMIPMYYKIPFITFGCKGIYEEMERIGFKSYRDCWDLSWTKADTMFERVNGCYMLLEYLQNLKLNDMVKVLEKAQSDVDYNHNHLTSGRFRIASNNQFFKEIENACS